MNEKSLNEWPIIEEALTKEHISRITKHYQSNHPDPEQIAKVDFTPGTESPAKLVQIIKQLMYDLAAEKAHIWVEKQKNLKTEKSL